MIHAQLDTNGLCIGYGNLNSIETVPNLVYLPDGWNEDFMYRKYENGAWSTDKFMPPVTPPGPDPDEELANAISAATTIAQLKDALLGGSGKLARVKARSK